jgi:glycerate kinase
MVQALGARLLAADGTDLGPGGAALAAAATLDLSGLHPGLATADVVVASDVDNPLTGLRGAATVFGPQKGAGPREVRALEAGLTAWADLVARTTGADQRDAAGAGAAGGVAFAALALLGASVRPGIEIVLDLVGFDEQLAGAGLVVVGEGSLDEQSLGGKAPVGVAARARGQGVPVVAVCGRSSLTARELSEAGIDAVYSLSDLEPDAVVAMVTAGPLLKKLGRRIARDRLRA